ncbi:MAG: efflux RND transporter periplasmic adaptor subunit [Acidobacteria bacterium]|nr:efflux RND transporter periplasmic adaptor subunit [Acidobacteriota bacterium]
MTRRGPVATCVLLAAAWLAGCGARGPAAVPTALVQADVFLAEVPARGELQAVETTPILAPTVWAPMTIAWTADDGASVHAGDVVVRLDDASVLEQIQAIENEIAKLDLQIESMQRSQELARDQLDGEIALLGAEMAIAKDFAPRDEQIFSRQEIIDSQVSLECLTAKDGIYRDKVARLRQKQAADLQILRLKRQSQELRLQQMRSSQTSLELKAPHDGVFLQGRNWRREVLRAGMPVWAGMKVGELPDMAAMEASVHVLESEAAGLQAGQSAAVALDAVPERAFRGKVKTVEAVAQPLEQDSPVKYFRVVISLDATDTTLMKPGREVAARIEVQRLAGTVSVPNQALFHSGEQNWVFVRDGSAFRRQAVKLGERGLTRTVIQDGARAGDEVALADPARG